MSILNFLLYWAGRVYEWFGWLYESGRNAALYAWSWAVNQGQIAYNLAVNFVIGKVNEIYSWAWSQVTNVYNQAVGYVNNVQGYLIGLYNSIYAWVMDQIGPIYTWVEARLRPILDWVSVKIDELSVWVYTEVNAVRDRIVAWVTPYLDLFNERVDVIQADIENRFGWVVEKDSSGNTVLYTFLSNPMGFIIAYVWSIFGDLLCYGLAYGLGSVKYDLPDLPDWSSPGITGGAIPPSNAPPGASGLLSPLNSISVSGYRFGSSHKGLDLGLSNGDPVYAMHDGEVTLTNASGSGYGNQVIVSGGRWWSRYAHMETIAVALGQIVRAGTAIGTGNSTGNSTGPHLHLEIKFDGAYIDPATVL